MANVSSDSAEYTLEDNVWKDSFDKLLDNRPVLRNLNVLKKQVRASFNIDSSIDNSNLQNSSLEVPYIRSISTPATKASEAPFKCSISPIGAWKLKFFRSNRTKTPPRRTRKLQSTVVNPEIVVVDYDNQAEEAAVVSNHAEKKDDTLDILFQKIIQSNRARRKQRQVLFKSNIVDNSKTGRTAKSAGQRQRKTSVSPKVKANEKTKPKTTRAVKSAGQRQIDESANQEKSTENMLRSKITRSVKSTGQRQSTETTVPKSKTNDIFRSKTARAVKSAGQRQRKTSVSPKVKANEKTKPKTTRAVKSAGQRQIDESANQEKSHENMLKSKTIRAVKSAGYRQSKGLAPQETKTYDINVTLHTGKWRKSLCVWRRTQLFQTQNRVSSRRISCQDESVQFLCASVFIGQRKLALIKPERFSEHSENSKIVLNWKERVMQNCAQTEPVSFEDVYSVDKVSNCCKIGEGAYGEVFLNTVCDEQVVCKIIPIEGELVINGEQQKNFEQILPEIVISKKLCALGDDGNCSASGFVNVKQVNCVQGKYPDHLIKLWEAYDEEKGSDNDNPTVFPDTQLYIVLELEYAGKDMESFIFKNAEQSYAALEQIVFSLAVAEEILEFEHRDLHWGNILLRPTTDDEINYKIAGRLITIPTKGIKMTIIDYTLSRINYDNHVLYNDLAHDEELFGATGDYQFDIYRMMREVLNNDWKRFEPKTNVFWISYIISKLADGVVYKNTRSKTHTLYMRKLRSLQKDVLEFDSANALAKSMRNLT